MSIELSLAALLTSYGNVHLHDGLSRADEQMLARPADNQWPLDRLTIGAGRAQPVAAALGDWLGRLRQERPRGLWLFGGVTIGDKGNGHVNGGGHVNGNGNGYRGAIYVETATPYALIPGRAGGKNGRDLVFFQVPLQQKPTIPTGDLAAAARRLEKYLGQARASEAARRYESLDQQLVAAGRVLAGAGQRRSALLPAPGYPGHAHRLVDAAAAAWVFDDSSVWNQLWFETEEASRRHYELTRALQTAVVGAYVAAANAYPIPTRAL